jgi:aspartyl-tRNA synthetase
MGWVQKRRNLGGMIFVDLRDRSGIMQIVFDENDIGSEGFEKAGLIRSEFVLAVTGRVEKRSGAVNEKLATGAMEVRAFSLRPKRNHAAQNAARIVNAKNLHERFIRLSPLAL